MKRFIGLILMMISLGALCACDGGNSGTADGEFKMKATVTALGEKMEISVTEAEYAEGIYWVVISDSTGIYDGEGNRIDYRDISIGDTVTVSYNGQVMMSYPPQVAAITVRLE